MGHSDDEKMHLKKEEKEKNKEPSTILLDKEEEEETTSVPATPTTSFFSRLASIPILQDSFMGAQNLVRQHAVGQKALDYAETKLQTIVVSAQSYLPKQGLSKANSLGNKSLDMLERRFPSISAPTNQLVQPITGCIESAVSHFRETKTTVVDPRIDYIANGFESLLDQYLPPSADDEDEKEEIPAVSEEKHGMDRLMHVINILSTRASKKISKKASATIDEERQIKQLIRAWVLEQANTMAHQPPVSSLQDQMELFKTKFLYENSPIQVMYDFTQTEFDKVLQELQKPNMSHMDRIRNILVLSQTDILVPLYQKSRSMIWSDKQEVPQDEVKELSVTPAA